MEFLLEAAFETKMLQENEEDTIEHVDHISDGGNDATMHAFAGLALAHFDGSFGDFIAAVKHFDDEIGIGEFRIVVEAGVFFDDATVEALKARERVCDTLAAEDADEKGENLLTEATEEGTFIARIFEIARANNDVGIGFGGGLVEFGSLGGYVLAVGIELDGVVIALGHGVLETGLDGPGVAEVKNIVNARDMERCNNVASGIGGIIIDD